jgi:hypothetical protein
MSKKLDSVVKQPAFKMWLRESQIAFYALQCGGLVLYGTVEGYWALIPIGMFWGDRLIQRLLRIEEAQLKKAEQTKPA